MKKLIEKFKVDKYVKVDNCVPLKRCQEITNHLFEMEKNKKTNSDKQCPLSSAIYADEYCEKLLFDMIPKIEQVTGKQLTPTYSYARIYKTGEILSKHIDRPACEISATITLGYDAKNVWKIFFSNTYPKGIDIEVGSMVVYRGMDLPHWRKKFSGKWQTQVFLHYVDKNGIYTPEALDKRNLATNERN